MNQFTNPRVFQAKPSRLKKQIFLAAGLAGAVALTLALLGKGPVDQRPYYFAGGITAMAFAFRFWSMQVSGGAPALTFRLEGVSVGNESSTASLPWSDVAAITYKVSRSGHRWHIASRSGQESLEFYLDGLTGVQRQELEATVKSIQSSDIKVVPVYDPLGFAEAA